MRVCLTIAVLFLSWEGSAFARTWTSTDDQTIEAEIVGKTETTVSLKTPNGQTLEVPINRLIVEDQLFIASWDSEEEGALEVIVWNQYNGRHRDRGTKSIQVEVFRKTLRLWDSGKVEMEWVAGKDSKVAIKVPKLSYRPDRVRVSVLEWVGVGGGLAEIELLQNGENIARNSQAKASAHLNKQDRFNPGRVIDGITSSQKASVGYWLLPSETAGWIELKLP